MKRHAKRLRSSQLHPWFNLRCARRLKGDSSARRRSSCSFASFSLSSSSFPRSLRPAAAAAAASAAFTRVSLCRFFSSASCSRTWRAKGGPSPARPCATPARSGGAPRTRHASRHARVNIRCSEVYTEREPPLSSTSASAAAPGCPCFPAAPPLFLRAGEALLPSSSASP